MKINKSSQLGLMMDDPNIQLEYLEQMKYHIKGLLDFVDKIIKENPPDETGVMNIDVEKYAEQDFDLKAMSDTRNIEDSVADCLINSGYTNNENFINNKNSKLYLICDGVEKCSKMIRIGDNFSTKALSNVKFGKHTYLLGKNEMCRFLCAPGAIKGVYWDRQNKIAFEFGFDLINDGYYFTGNYGAQFNRVAKILTFVELGDIEVLLLEKGRNNGKAKKSGKIINDSNFNVYVVDSSWNKLIIRTEGFAVMGHFRLQPCGKDFSERKLIWIDAFEKHGYKRRPRGEIIHG